MKKMVLSPRAIFVSLLVTGAALVSACSSPGVSSATPAPGADVNADAVEIVRGIPDLGRDPGVVAIDVGEQGLCSGALIAPDVVLTARHCVAHTIDQIACPASQSQVGTPRSPASLQILVGDEVGLAKVVAHGKEIIAPKGRSLCEADIALIVLDQPVTGVTPLDVRETGVAVGDHIRSVGFGRAGDAKAAGLKLLREHVLVLEASATEFTVGEATCQGDSGGPAIDEETGEIVGVVSRGGPTCDGTKAHNIYTRTDAFLPLLEEALQRAGSADDGSTIDALDGGSAPPPKHRDAGRPHKDGGAHGKKPASDLGGTCKVAADCAAAVCVSELGKQYCSRPCGTHDRCPAHFTCKMATSGTKVCIEH